MAVRKIYLACLMAILILTSSRSLPKANNSESDGAEQNSLYPFWFNSWIEVRNDYAVIDELKNVGNNTKTILQTGSVMPDSDEKDSTKALVGYGFANVSFRSMSSRLDDCKKWTEMELVGKARAVLESILRDYRKRHGIAVGDEEKHYLDLKDKQRLNDEERLFLETLKEMAGLGMLEFEITSEFLNNDNLSVWVGNYRFYEFGEPHYNNVYRMEIYKGIDGYYAEIRIDNPNEKIEILKAKAQGNQESIDIVFEMCLSNNDLELYDKDDILFSFRMENEEMHTYWGSLQPTAYANKESGRVYFKKIGANPELDNSDLSMWVGNYKFYEFAEPHYNMVYKMKIYEENDNYYAEIVIDGFQTMKRLKAKVQGSQESIDIVFEMYLPDNMWELYDKDDFLFSLKMENGEMHTYWGLISAMIITNRESGKSYFEKIEIG